MALLVDQLERMVQEADTPEKARAALHECEVFLSEHPNADHVRDWAHLLQMVATTPGESR